MSLRELFLQLLSVTVQLIIVFVGGYVLKYLEHAKYYIQDKAGREFYDFAYSVTKLAVQAVEQKYPMLRGEEKYNIVAKKLNERFGNYFNQDELEELIESAVQEMNYIKKNYNKPQE